MAGDCADDSDSVDAGAARGSFGFAGRRGNGFCEEADAGAATGADVGVSGGPAAAAGAGANVGVSGNPAAAAGAGAAAAGAGAAAAGAGASASAGADPGVDGASGLNVGTRSRTWQYRSVWQ
jgi:hypothetical protein